MTQKKKRTVLRNPLGTKLLLTDVQLKDSFSLMIFFLFIVPTVKKQKKIKKGDDFLASSINSANL